MCAFSQERHIYKDLKLHFIHVGCIKISEVLFMILKIVSQPTVQQRQVVK